MTLPEIKAQQILESIGFYVKPAKEATIIDSKNCFYSQFTLDEFRLDFALPSAQIAIEINGEYWHGTRSMSVTSKQLIRKIGDSFKSSYLRQRGWKIISISANALDRSTIRDRLQDTIFALITV